MDIETRKKWKSRLLVAGMHLQAWPVLGLGALYSRFLRKRNPEIFYEDCVKDAFNHKMERLDPDHIVNDRVDAWAQLGGLRLTGVFMRQNFAFRNAWSRSSGAETAVFFDGDPLSVPRIGPIVTDYVIGHELTHAVRETGRHRLEAEQNIDALGKGIVFHAGAFGTMLIASAVGVVSATTATYGAMAALVALSTSAFSGLIGIPMMQKMFERNEEYLADIGAVRFTGDIPGAMITNQFLQGHGSGTGPRSLFGHTHPSFEQRKNVLCQVFNVTKEQREVAERLFAKPPANGNADVTPHEVKHG